MEMFNKELINSILNVSKLGIWIYEKDDDGSEPRLFFDDSLKNVCGIEEDMTPEESYWYWRSRIVPEYLDIVYQTIGKIIEGEHTEVQYEWEHPSRGRIFVRNGGLKDDTYTKGVRTVGLLQDVTELVHMQRKQYERELKEVREYGRTRSIIACLADDYDFVGHIDNRTNKLKVYRATSKFMDRLDVDDLFPSDTGLFKVLLIEHLWPEDQDLFARKGDKEEILKEVRKNPTYQFNFRLLYKGEPEYYRITFANSQEDSGGLILGITNVDYLFKAIERGEQLQKTIAQVQEENQAKTSFLFNMSHDIRTPMNAITGYTAMAKKYIKYPDRVADYLEKIDLSGQQLLRLINQVLDMSRIESGKIVLNEEPLDIVSRIDDILTIVDSSARNNGIKLKGVKKNITNRVAYVDDLRVNQITINVLGNAVKYTRPGGTVTCTLEQLRNIDNGKGHYRITVADTGIGMSEEFISKIFDEFSRERNSTSSKIEGTGLGMAIVKKLCDALGAAIDIQSHPGKGTTVTLDFYFRIAEDETLPVKETTQADTEVLNNKKVLLVEDNEMNREIARSILEEYGMIVCEAEDGDIAVRKITESEPGYFDYILMDVQMPRMNGFEATRAIRELPDKTKANIPIIAMTANAFSEDKQRVLASGMDAHLPKPIDITDLIITLGRFSRGGQ